MSDTNCTLFVGNLSDKVTEEILFELFLQAGPVKTVCIPKDNKTGRLRNFAFVTFKHEVSVKYSIDLLNGIKLFNLPLTVNVRRNRNGAESPQPSNDERMQQASRDLRTQVMNGQMFHAQMMHQEMPPGSAAYYQQPIAMNSPWTAHRYVADEEYRGRHNHTPRQNSYHDRRYGREVDEDDRYGNSGHERRKKSRHSMSRSQSGPSNYDRDYRKQSYRRR